MGRQGDLDCFVGVYIPHLDGLNHSDQAGNFDRNLLLGKLHLGAEEVKGDFSACDQGYGERCTGRAVLIMV